MAKSSRTTLTGLSLLTITTGLVDAATVLGFTVFAANMTGNVVFLGFALGGSPEYALIPSLAALIGFVLGAWCAGFIVPHRLVPRAASTALGLQTVLLIAAAITATMTNEKVAGWHDWLLLLLLGAAMGLQNVIALASPVADMKTTVLTLTIAGFAADIARGKQQKWGLRVSSVALLLAGALSGTLIFRTSGMAWTLAVATFTTALAGVMLRRSAAEGVWDPARH